MAVQSQKVYTCDGCGNDETVLSNQEPSGIEGTVIDRENDTKVPWYADNADCVGDAVNAVLNN